MRLTMLGTGNAVATECYNTCYVFDDDGAYFMVDGGGGNGVLRQLKAAGFDWTDMRRIFVTHAHMDHLLGVVWMVRMICQAMHAYSYEGEAFIYGHDEVVSLLGELAERLLAPWQTAFIGSRLHLVEVHDGERLDVNGRAVTFFDIHSTKTKQFGYTLDLGGGRRLACCGDETFNERCRPYVEGSDWLLHEAFCLRSQADVFRPYEKHHSTALDAARIAESLGVRNLLLYHTEDGDLAHRKERYTAEARSAFHGNVFVPDDLETLEL